MQPESTTTRRCGSHGDYRARLLIAPIPDMPALFSGCPHCHQDLDKTEQRQKARAGQQMRSRKLREIISRCGIPPRFAAVDFHDYHATLPGQKLARTVCQTYAATWPEQYRKGGSLVLTGRCGNGKTHLACAIANQVMAEHLATVCFGTAPELLRTVRITYGKNSEHTETQAIADLLAPDLLIIDEIGAQRGTDHEVRVLFEIINGRYQRLRPTILLSNLTADELQQFLGERSMDRLRECGPVLAFNWASFRSTSR